ncbi:MAG: GGDEF domain-containing protein [Anaerolineales bacterium]|nr:GGDEF domain-containing protein [Anaerolineales bacterium]
MFSIPQFDKDDLFQRYKRQTYLIAFPLGALLVTLYIANALTSGVMFYIAIFMVVELLVLSFFIWQNTPFLNTIELIFYFSVAAYFFVLIQFVISKLAAANLLTLASLSEQLNALSMWLTVLLFGAFFTLKPGQTKVMLAGVFTGMISMFIYNTSVHSIADELAFSIIFRWINPISCLVMAALIIQYMGVLQQKRASTDALTGFLNRHALYSVLLQEMERSIRYKRPFSIVLFDIDEFKLVNDTFGHLEGDKVLKELSKLVVSLMRKTDYVGRWGGEEFLLVLPETDSNAAQTIAERFRAKIEETHFMENYFIAASFGVTTYEASSSVQEMLSSADVALYQAKNNGRNQVVVKSMTKV